MIKNKKILFLLFIIIFFIFSAKPILALELKYPQIPGLPNINNMNDDDPNLLGHYIGYFFGLGIYLVGVLSLISFTIGAVSIIVAGDSNPEGALNGKDRMKGSILGLVLTMAAFVILRTININFITPSLPLLPGVEGIYLTNGTLNTDCPIEWPNMSTLSAYQKGYTKIKYQCSPGASPDTTPALLIWGFPDINYGGYDQFAMKVIRLPCGQPPVSISDFGSFKIGYETPGAYYYLGENCTGYASSANPISQDDIGAPFKGNIKSVKFVNDAANNLYYGAIFHQEVGLTNGGECTDPLPANGGDCQNVNIPASAVDIFTFGNNSSGNGVTFYSDANGRTGSNSAYYEVKKEDIGHFFKKDTGEMCFDYFNVDKPDKYRNKCAGNKQCHNNTVGEGAVQGINCEPNACETFEDCPGSIEIKGTYLVALYSEDLIDQTVYCRTFTQSAPALNDEQILANGSTSVGSVYVIPIK